jgi:cardiolipin synthase A/B
MRGLTLFILVVLIFPISSTGLSSPTSASYEDRSLSATVDPSYLSLPPSVLITEVSASYPTEYVIISDLGSQVDLKNWALSDGEGVVRFVDSFVLDHDRSIALAVNTSLFASVHLGLDCLELSSPLLDKAGRFTLADAGDDICLLDERGTEVDCMVYGTGAHAGGWEGPAVPKMGKGHIAIRVGGDSDSSKDWVVKPPGCSDWGEDTFTGVVEPFSAPENAEARILRELGLASSTVAVAVYELTDSHIVHALLECVNRGVKVSILLEGQPVSGMSNSSLRAAWDLRNGGCDLHLLRSADGFKRYDYLHCKYMVVDNRRTMVLSENWGSGLIANRGWGVVVDSVPLASYMLRLFDDDRRGSSPDVSSVIAPLPSGAKLGEDHPIVELGELVRYRAVVRPIVSPDYSLAHLTDLLATATDQVLVQQLSVEPEWVSSPGLLSDLLSAAARGVKVRLLLDDTWASEEGEAVVNYLNSKASANGLDLEARSLSPYHEFGVLHNKGVIVDDRVVVSSINWVDTALMSNREIGLDIDCPQITSYFSDLFWSDWAVDPYPPVISLNASIVIPGGAPVFIDAVVTDNGGAVRCEWDINGDGIMDYNGSTILVHLLPGNYTFVLTASDRFNNAAQASIRVQVLEEVGQDLAWWPIAPLVAIPLVAGTWVVWKSIKHRMGH